ncbi:Fasciclin-2 [Nymphon striatum]|nr:Fasciclin-2 [Nymphon striatum]
MKHLMAGILNKDPGITAKEDGPNVCTNKETGSISLFLKDIKSEYGGVYTCSGLYTGNRDVEVSHEIIVQRDITWVNCLESQEVVLGESASIQCEVLANPPAEIQWKDQNADNIINNKKFNIEGNGLTIRNVSISDGGVYTVIARVSDTGSYKEKDITVKVQAMSSQKRKVPENGDVSRKTARCSAQQVAAILESDDEETLGFDEDYPSDELKTDSDDNVNVENDNDSESDSDNENPVDRLPVRPVIGHNLDSGWNKKYVGVNKHLGTITVPPTITSPPEDVVAVETKEARMQCVAEGDPKPIITWLNEDSSDLQTNTDEYTIDQSTGELIIKSARKDQEGTYTCRADNSAGQREAKAKLTVVIMPKIEKFENLTVRQNDKAVIKCASSGDPPPKITIKKVGNDNPENNDRVMTSPAESEVDGWTVTQLTILNVSRSDDGLYSCVSENQGGQVELKGHITVQHAPLMYETPSTEVVSWQENPLNMTCVARSIPNATIEWWYNNGKLQSGSGGYKIFGNGPISVLNIEKPTERDYGSYSCKAINPIGSNETRITLKEVFRPGRLMQAIISKITATTLTIKISSPDNDGGTAISGYIGEYKKVTSPDWLVKKWNALSDSFILEGLVPGEEYDFRFAAQNIVGTGEFIDAGRTTMRDKAAPEPPTVITKNPSGVAFSPYQDKFRVSWSVPQNNGELIKAFLVTYYEVKNDTGKWEKNSDFKKITVDHDGSNYYVIDKLSPETFYKIELRAQNKLGNSQSSTAIFRTSKDDGRGIKKELSSVDRRSEGKSLKTAEVVGIIIGILVIIIIIADVSCGVMKKCGLTLFVCTKLRGEDKSDEKSKEFLEDGKLSSTEKGIQKEVKPDINDAVVAVDEKEPLRNGDKMEAANADAAMMKGDKAKENEGLDVNNGDSDIKPPKDSAV